jgi:tetratricopeptide (TPR) repeat protein
VKHVSYWFALVSLSALTLSSCRSPDTAETTAKPTAKVSTSKPAIRNKLDPAFATFVAARRRQAEVLDRDLKLNTPAVFWSYFDAAAAGDWKGATNLFTKIRDYPLAAWPPVNETRVAMEAFTTWDNRLLHAFGDGIIRSVPAGSIYFSGTNTARFIVAALCRSEEEGDPFFHVSPNALANGPYLNSLGRAYGKKIYTPSADDAQRAFNEYLADAQKRLDHDRRFPGEPKQLKPGETAPGPVSRVQVSGDVAVTAINGRLAQLIFDKNPEREFYLEAGAPRPDWMNSRLLPQGPVLKLNRQPHAELSEEAVQRDQEFWAGQTAQWVGNWLTNGTSIQDVCAFAERIGLRKDWAGFSGDRAFLEDPHASSAFARARGAIADLYLWRATNAASATEKRRYGGAAELAFKQALAFGPTTSDVVFRCVNFLVTQERLDDAIQVAGTAQILEPSNPRFDGLLRELGRINQELKNRLSPEQELAVLQEQFHGNTTNLQTATKLVKIYLQLRQTNSAVATVEGILVQAHDRKAELHWAAQIYSQAPDFQRLEAIEQKLIKLDPTDPDAWYELAAAQMQLGRRPEGLQSLNMALRLGQMRQSQDPGAPDLLLKSRQDPRLSFSMNKPPPARTAP